MLSKKIVWDLFCSFRFTSRPPTSNVNEKKCKSPTRALWKFNFHMNRMCLRNMAAKPNARVSEYAISSTCGGLRAGAKFMIYLKCFETEFAKGIEMEFIWKVKLLFIGFVQCFDFHSHIRGAQNRLMWNTSFALAGRRRENLLKLYWVYDLC